MVLFPSPALAYIDPASGSVIISLIIGIFGSVIFSIKALFYRIKSLYFQLLNKGEPLKNTKIILYSEGPQYWNTFEPILTELHKQKIDALFVSSDPNDLGLKYVSEFISVKFIGQGNKAYAYLNTVECDICLMTTPGLETLYIKRSKGIKHYAYIPHSPIDMGKYKMFSFEAFDTVFVSGEHQEKSLRVLERMRNTRPKEIISAGCPYMDTMGKKLASLKEVQTSAYSRKPNILIAPTWGKNNLLRKIDTTILKQFLHEDFNITIRPHPQSMISENALLNKLKQQLGEYDNLYWDTKSDNFDSLVNADVLISDISGIIFDFAFIFEKPVISVIFDYDFSGYEGNDFNHCLWELTMLEKIGISIHVDNLSELKKAVDTLTSKNIRPEYLAKLREENLFNYKKSAEIIVNYINEVKNNG